MHKKLFIVGIIIFLGSFVVPVDDEFGYTLALIPFHADDIDISELFNIFLMLITNIAAIVTILSYPKFSSRFVSGLSAVGSVVSFYWLLTVIEDGNLEPYATIVWMTGSILLTLGYELKRRSVRISN